MSCSLEPFPGGGRTVSIVTITPFTRPRVPAAVVLAVAVIAASPVTWADLPLCEGEPLRITEECQDPRFNQPVIETEEYRNTPVPHYYVNGHFAGTDARFSFYFPQEGYEGRFFQFTHQLNSSENATATNISFAIDSGGYLVQTNMGGSEAIRSTEAALVDQLDPTVVGYRVNAASARFSREVAAQIFGEHRPYGYLSGGSGGALQTIASMQNTTIWDGGVPYIQPNPLATPHVYTARTHGLRILRDGAVNRFPQILDAIDPGGSGDPYAHLDQEQAEALEEATRMGFPMRGWFDWPTMTIGALRLVAGYVPFLDPDYFEDYWTTPGYLGHDDPYGSVAAALVVHDTAVAVVSGSAVILQTLPAGSVVGAQLKINSGALSGQEFTVVSGVPGGVFVIGNLAGLQPGDQVTVSNRDALALQTYHRHQIPDVDRYAELSEPLPFIPALPDVFPHMPPWDQFLDENGEPIYPQRDPQTGPASTFYGSGSIQSGHFHGRMLGMQTMMDIDAFPWLADWYKRQVDEVGNSDRYRLYYIDHADHGSTVSGARQARIVSFRGALEQLLRDLAAWVEDGVEPPKQTQYTMNEAQVVLPANASARRGIQPVVTLKANGGERADVRAGERVRFQAQVQVPQNVGKVVGVEWDFYGTGQFEPVDLGMIRPGTVNVRAEHVYSQPGTYFPVLRATSHREGNASAIHARVQNLGRVRVVVE